MFAIPGWSVSAEKLRPETASASAKSQPPSSTGPDTSTQPPQKKRKRKQQAGPDTVTPENVAGLWEKVVEGKTSGEPGKQNAAKNIGPRGVDAARANGKRKRDAAEVKSEETDTAAAKQGQEGDGRASKKKKRSRAEKRQGASTDNGSASVRDGDGPARKGSTKPKASSAESPAPLAKASHKPNPKPVPTNEPAPAALTPLQKSMRDKLISARFRHLNEALYTRPSAEAFEMFAESPEMFSEYHEGFRRQVQVWPENPVDGYIAAIRDRARRKPPPPSRSGVPHPAATCPLPRTEGLCRIADLGCGDGRLAQTLQPEAKRLRVEVLSFDLQANGPHVTRADISALPLTDGSVDVAIFCLALMGTNWISFVEEAYRVLRWKGELWVAEIKSRFGRPGGKKDGAGAVVEHSVGKRRHPVAGAAKKKGDPASEAAAEELDLAIEVDGAVDARRETDVASFVDALRKRGFVLHADRGSALDLSNKMFVKMHFVKTAEPTKGKGVVAKASKAAAGSRRPGFLSQDRFAEPEDEGETEAEISILKPCVYKLR